MKTLRIVVLSAAISATAHSATIVGVEGITGHDGGNWPDYAGHLTDMVNANNTSLISTTDTITTGMDMSADPSDPSQWTWSGGYTSTWHANSVLSGAANSKLGWVVVDFGSVINNLDNLYMWASGGASTAEQVNGFNIYYSSGTSIDALPAMPKSKGTTGDYDFSSGDWALIGASTLAQYSDGSLTNTFGLAGVSAQYIGIEITSLHGAGSRMAIGQIEFTAVPEPSAAILGTLGLLGLVMRRRR